MPRVDPAPDEAHQPAEPASPSALRALGVLAILGYAVHAAVSVSLGEWETMLWTCHVGALAVGIGLLIGRSETAGVGALWLAVGTPVWAFSMVSGGRFVPTSVLTHVGGLALGGIAVSQLGMRSGLWIRATAALVALHLLTRLACPPDRNVNLARAAWEGAAAHWSHAQFLGLVVVALALAFLALERLARCHLAA